MNSFELIPTEENLIHTLNKCSCTVEKHKAKQG